MNNDIALAIKNLQMQLKAQPKCNRDAISRLHGHATETSEKAQKNVPSTETECQGENPLHSYARFLCELSLGYEAHLGVKVDPHLEKRFCMAYHSGNANVLLQAFLVMQGEISRRARIEKRRE